MTFAADAVSAEFTPRKIQLSEFEQLRLKTNHVVLDVRTPEEFSTGHVEGATNVNFKDPNFAQTLQTLDKSKTYLVHCARGHRSHLAALQMAKLGLTNVIDFAGGMEGWRKADKPVAR